MPDEKTTPKSRSTKVPRVLRHVCLEGKWQLLPVAKVDGKLKWTHVMKKKVLIPAPAGTFYLEYREKGKKRRAVGTTPREAMAAMASQAAVLELRARGVETEDAPEIHARRPREGKSIKQAVDDFVGNPPLGLREISIGAYTFNLRQFEAWAKGVRKTHLSQLARQDIRDFMTHLVRTEGLALKTAINKAVIVKKQLVDAGAVIKMQKGDWPQVTEEQPDIYTPEMLKPLFKAMRKNDFVLYQTFLLTGFRDQEVGFLSWADFNPRNGTLSVTKKKGYKFDPKNYMERTNPIPPVLVELLKLHKVRQEDGEFLIFPTAPGDVDRDQLGGQRDKHMLRKLKRIAWRAGLNCGRCHSTLQGKPVSCADRPVCELWGLHKFRHTFATTMLQDGYDIYTVQKLLGHRKIESTLKYLRMMPAASLTEKMKSAAVATMFVDQVEPES